MATIKCPRCKQPVYIQDSGRAVCALCGAEARAADSHPSPTDALPDVLELEDVPRVMWRRASSQERLRQAIIILACVWGGLLACCFVFAFVPLLNVLVALLLMPLIGLSFVALVVCGIIYLVNRDRVQS